MDLNKVHELPKTKFKNKFVRDYAAAFVIAFACDEGKVHFVHDTGFRFDQFFNTGVIVFLPALTSHLTRDVCQLVLGQI
ncbi:hypothetical protein VI03_14290 [Burkholderia vietnamiensis]|nr:hypothetical protein VI03_14290 [Burkholderia vietnamiensis]